MSNMRIDLTGNFTAFYMFIQNDGNVTALLSNLGIDLDLELSTKKGNTNELTPNITVKNLKINVDKNTT